VSWQEPAAEPEVTASADDDLLEALRSPDVLKMLEISEEQLLTARDDADLLATLRITHEVLIALKDAGVLDVFLQLPFKDRANFIRWIGGIDEEGIRAVRTQSFVAALRTSPVGAEPGSGTVPLEEGGDGR
jgi:hypothetical protein